MGRKQAAAALLLLAGSSLSGCVAVAIPALAGSAMVGSRVIDGGGEAPQAAAAAPAPQAPVSAPVAGASPAPAAAPAPSAPPVAIPAIAAAPAPAPAPVPAPVAAPPPPRDTRPVAVPTPPAAAPVAAPATPAAPAAVAAAPSAATAAAAALPPPAAYPDPGRPLPPSQANFARFVRYGQATARTAESGAGLPSAILADAVAVDGKRRRCAVGEQLVAVIDLDPAGGIFAPPTAPAPQPALALGLAVLRDAGVEIAWLSDLTTDQSGALRNALEQSGLDPRGQDIISLRRDGGEGKQQRRDNLAGIACIIAIAGDERPDFDERFKYLRSPEAGAELEPLIGDGWFLIQPLLGN